MPAPKKTTTKGKKTRVRMYRVGFGDFFLVSVPTTNGTSHILVDCGVHAGDIGSIDDAVADMAVATGNHLSLVIATHRHADHISGFATCAERFRQMTVDAVWMSAWDAPGNADTEAVQEKIAALASRIETRLAASASKSPAVAQARDMVGNALGKPMAAAGGGGTLRGNAAALAMLRGTPASDTFRFRNAPVRRYYKAGDVAELPADLVAAGVTATVLGPPVDPDVVSKMDNAARQYLSIAGGDDGDDALRPFGADWEAGESAYPKETLRPFRSAKEMADALARTRPEAVLEAAKSADQAINNQSLVVHFSIRGKSLLFVGDAQWGNWSNFLFGRALAGAESAPLLSDSATLMQSLDFYKVGHHGSTNATPIDAVAALGTHCAAMCSTEIDCYGSEDNHSEVPRKPLLDALGKKTGSRLVRSDAVTAGTGKVVDGGPLPKGFTTPGNLFVDYML